jgi:hypothetical protein
MVRALVRGPNCGSQGLKVMDGLDTQQDRSVTEYPSGH